jgi:hypothetical protein
MQEILYNYEPPSPTTWVYLSSLIVIAVYFKFRRFWSVRNLDIIGLILLAPGLLMVASGRDMRDHEAGSMELQSQTPDSEKARVLSDSHNPSSAAAVNGETKVETGENPSMTAGRQLERRGYLWIFVVSGFFLFRMLVDSAMVRRPLLEPNLSASGLTFTCAALLVFLMSNVVTRPAATNDGAAARPGEKVQTPAIKAASREKSSTGEIAATTRNVNAEPSAKDANSEISDILKQRGPGYPLFHVFSGELGSPAKRAAAIIAHLAVVLGMVLIGYRHFDNTHTGIAAATLYLLLPYTANYTPRIDHVVPAALLVLAIQSYRRPVVAGIFVGLAAGLIWYPLFLLPLWCSFYWRRGLLRFTLAVLFVLGLFAASLAITAITYGSLGSYWEQFAQTFGLMHVHSRDIHGFWEGALTPFRYPVIAAFIAMCVCMALWPAQKNLGSLLACSAAIMLGTQFWKAYEGGTFMAWYLPLLILTIFRPNLEDRVALSAISEGWVKWRK